MTTISKDYVRYSADIEQVADDEIETFDAIVETMRSEWDTTRERMGGHTVRPSHAKAHGLAIGELRVLDDLPTEFRQGIFEPGRAYAALVRLAHTPGELLDDRKVSTPRGMAIKLLGVEGPVIAEHDGEGTQDFLLANGDIFIAPDAKAFSVAISATASSTPLPEAVKGAVSSLSRATNKALNAIGLDSANLDFFGHPRLHPLAETYFSQAPLRFGDYVGKLRARPLTTALAARAEEIIEIDEENGLRSLVTATLSEAPAEFEIAIQLSTDQERMPVEDAHKHWDEAESPYVAVARLTLPAQDAYSEGRRNFVEERVSFSPAHSLVVHRPLGSIMRARLHVYPQLAKERLEANGTRVSELRSINDVPD